MIYLTKEQLSMLKRCSEEVVDCKKLTNQEIQIINLLEQNHFVLTSREMVPMFFNGMPNPYKGRLISAQISEGGKSYLVEKSVDAKRYRQPLIISIISLLISLSALLLSIFL